MDKCSGSSGHIVGEEEKSFITLVSGNLQRTEANKGALDQGILKGEVSLYR
jgi:hypothetical protein